MITGKQFACTVQILAIHVLSIFILDAAGFSFTSFMKSKHKSKYTQQNINKLKCAPKKKYIPSISNKTKFCSKCIQGFKYRTGLQ